MSTISPPPVRAIGAEAMAFVRAAPWGCAVVFSAVVLACYFELATRVGPSGGALSASLAEIPGFFWAQFGLLTAPLAATVVRPALGGRVLQLYLAASTLALLWSAHDWRTQFSAASCAAWFVCAAQTMRLSIRRSTSEAFACWPLASAALLAVVTMGCTALALVHGLTRVRVMAFAIALALPGLIDLWRRRGECGSLWRRPIAVRPLECILCEAIWLPLAMTFVWACVDDVWSDATRVHLPHARQMVIEGGLPSRVAGDWFRWTPSAVQTAYAGAAAASTFRVAKWLSWSALAVLAFVVADDVNRPGRGRVAYLGAAAVTLACPILLWEATTLFVDHFACLFTVAAFVVLFRADRFETPRAFWFSAALMGVGVQVKYQTLVAGAVWCVAAAVLLLRRQGLTVVGLKRLCGAYGVFAVCAAPWYLHIWRLTGNPVYPFLNGVFHSPYWPDGMSTDFDMEMFRLREITQWLTFPWLATFHTSRLGQISDGALGAWGLALLPFLLVPATRGRPGRGLWWAGAAIVLGISFKAPYLRYWLPAYPLMLIPLMQGAAASFRRPAPRWATWAAGPLAIGMMAATVAIWVTIGGFRAPWLVFTGQKSREQWMCDWFPGHAAVSRLNRRIDAREGALCVNYLGTSGINARAFEFRESSLAVDGPYAFADLPAYLDRNKIRYWVVNYASPIPLQHSCRLECHRYWADDYLVAASQGLAVYDTDPGFAAAPYAPPTHRDIPPVIVPFTDRRDTAGWIGLPASLDRETPCGQQTLRIDSGLGQCVCHNFSLPAGTTLFRCAVPLRSEQGSLGPQHVVLRVDWFDAQANKLGSEGSNYLLLHPRPVDEASQHSASFHGPYVQQDSEDLGCVFSEPPAGAVWGSVSVIAGNSRIWIQTACLSFWQDRHAE